MYHIWTGKCQIQLCRRKCIDNHDIRGFRAGGPPNCGHDLTHALGARIGRVDIAHGRPLFGGGLDFGKHKLVFRAVQLDWMMLRFNGITDKNNVRVNTGLLYRF